MTKKPSRKNKPVGSKAIFTPEQVQMIKQRLAHDKRWRDWLLFSLGINGKLREGDLLPLRVSDVSSDSGILSKGILRQEKTGKPHEFVIAPDARDKLREWIADNNLQDWDYLFYGRNKTAKHISKRQLCNLVKSWAAMIGLEPSDYATHSLRRTGADYFYRRTQNIRATQLMLGHSNIQTTVRYLGIDAKEAMELAEMYVL